MKKIAILTWLHNGNFGSVLQAVALQRYLTEQGFDVTDLDYNASLKTKLFNWAKCKNSPKLFWGKFEEVKRKKSYKDPQKFEERERLFDEFEERWLKRSALCRSIRDIKRESEQYNIFICGSDQIWSPALLNPVFYLDFVPENKYKIAYAPSFGVISATLEKKKKIAGFIKKFDAVSVRETQGQEFIREITGEIVPIAMDPTLLIDEKIWSEYSTFPKVKESYILCYLLTPNKTYIEFVSKFAKKKGMKVVIIPTAKGPFDTNFEELIDLGPAQWLGLIQNAEYVLTDSFHGCIFSIIFHKEFILFKRFKDSNKVSENSRIYTLAEMLNVEDRIVDETNMERIGSMKSLDFEAIDCIIENRAEISKKWLLDVLKKAGA